MITAVQTHWGQYKPYGDSMFEWDVTVTEEEGHEEILKYCLALDKGFETLPPMDEWRANIRIGGAKEHDMRYFFDGCYRLDEKINIEDLAAERVYHFTVIKPFTD